jgi:homoserine O-acetyltransferase/O-succinyltransferase
MAPRPSHLCIALLLGSTSYAPAQDSTSHAPPHQAAHHVFTLPRFTFEGGATVPNVKLVYGTYGRLNARRDNAILLPSHYMADHHGYDWLIGPGLALDTSRYFLVATELFGNGHSSSPSNTPAPFHGPQFPLATIRDNVEAVHRLLVDHLGIRRLQAIIGFSMGAEQAFQWAVSYPEFSPKIVATAGTAKAWPHGVVRLESQIAAIQLDPAFNNGNYTTPPKGGLELFALIWAPWLFSQEWWKQELWQVEMPGATLDSALSAFRKAWVGLDANDLILQARTWQRHDVGTTKGFNGSAEKALGSIRARVLYMPSETDLYFPVTDARYEARFIPHVALMPIPSLWGHTAGAAADSASGRFLNQHIGEFIRAAP